MITNEKVRLAANFVDTLVLDRAPELWRNILINIESKGLMLLVVAVIGEMTEEGRKKFIQIALCFKPVLMEPINGKIQPSVERFFQLLDIMTLSYHGKY